MTDIILYLEAVGIIFLVIWGLRAGWLKAPQKQGNTVQWQPIQEKKLEEKKYKVIDVLPNEKE